MCAIPGFCHFHVKICPVRLPPSFTIIVYSAILWVVFYGTYWEKGGENMAKKKEPPPAKIKYDKSHPIVSIRLTPELKKKLEEIKVKSGKTPADILKEALEIQAPSVNDAWTRGYLSAQFHHGVSYHCSVCGKSVNISTPEERKAAAEYMEEHRWGHGECINKDTSA